MMKIEYLIDNRELVMELLNNWEYDPQGLELLNEYRISSNAIYPYWNRGRVEFLRFSPNAEKSPQAIEAEVEYLDYLYKKGFSVPPIILSKGDKKVITIDTKWGNYSALVFGEVSGIRLDRVELTDELIIAYGKELAKLHKLSQDYIPVNQSRVTCFDQLEWMGNVLDMYQDEDKARQELSIITHTMVAIGRNNTNFGLVHYDYELDNIFYDEELKVFSVIDFDDSMYHWYVVDIIKAAMNIDEEDSGRSENEALCLLIQGYSEVLAFDKEILYNIDIFRRYIKLYSYVRCIRAISEVPEVQPEWMKELVKNIRSNVNIVCCEFGKD